MKVRGKLLAFSVVATLGLSLIGSAGMAASYVGTVVLNQGTYNSGYGGEFSADLTYANTALGAVANQVSPAFVQHYAGTNGANNTTATNAVFQTFCVEEGIHDVVFSPGTFYAATIGFTDGLPQTLNPGAAYLFDQFWKGTLVNYNYANTSNGRSASAGALQAAIWYLEGDQLTLGATFSDAGISSNGAAQLQAQAWVTLAQLPHPNAIPPVQIFGMYDTLAHALAGGRTGIAQAQLVEIPPAGSSNPVPLPAAAGVGFSMLGGFGLLAGWRKRFRRRLRIA